LPRAGRAPHTDESLKAAGHGPGLRISPLGDLAGHDPASRRHGVWERPRRVAPHNLKLLFPSRQLSDHARGRVLAQLPENVGGQPPGHVRGGPSGAQVLPARPGE
jgi:hypothetical protein